MEKGTVFIRENKREHSCAIVRELHGEVPAPELIHTNALMVMCTHTTSKQECRQKKARQKANVAHLWRP